MLVPERAPFSTNYGRSLRCRFVDCDVISQRKTAAGGRACCLMSLTSAGWGSDTLLNRTLLPHAQAPELCAVRRRPGLWRLCEDGMVSPHPETGLFYQLFRMKAFKRSMPQICMFIGDILYLQCEKFYLITCLGNLSDSSLIPLAGELPPKIASGLFLSVFYFLAHKITRLSRVVLEYLQKTEQFMSVHIML